MAYGIDWAQKFGKQNRKRLDNTTDPYSEPSSYLYSYDRLNENTDSNTTVILPPYFDTSIQPQQNNDSDSSAGAKDVTPAGLDQHTNHHGNKDGKDNNDSQ